MAEHELIWAIVVSIIAVAVSIGDLNWDKFAMSRLDGKLANIYSDIDNKELTKMGRFKLLVTGDPVDVQQKFKEPYVLENSAKMLYSTNQIPEIDDNTDSTYRRFQVIEFTQQFRVNPTDKEIENGIMKEDPDLLNKICTENEFSGILNLLIFITKKFQKKKVLSYGQTIEQVRAIMKEQADPVRNFASSCLVEDINYLLPKSLVTLVYGKWARKHKQIVKDDKTFGSKLKRVIGVEASKKRVPSYNPDSKSPIAVWLGIRFNKKLTDFVPDVPNVPYKFLRKQKEDIDNYV